ncbi:MAG: hypothetical protein ACREN7_08235, partial [Candidatus Dormibacteria bacterium]
AGADSPTSVGAPSRAMVAVCAWRRGKKEPLPLASAARVGAASAGSAGVATSGGAEPFPTAALVGGVGLGGRF